MNSIFLCRIIHLGYRSENLMRFPRRSVKSISSFSGRQLPSLITFFPANQLQNVSEQDQTQNSPTRIEDGIELVPIERQDTSCGKILTPGQEEKEVTSGGKAGIELWTKPLPNLPTTKWSRMPVKRRIITILCIQFCMLLTIALSLMSVKKKASFGQRQEQG